MSDSKTGIQSGLVTELLALHKRKIAEATPEKTKQEDALRLRAREELEKKRAAEALLLATQQRDAKVVEVDTALGLLTTARSNFTAKYADGPDDNTVNGLTARRDTLANADTKEAIDTQLGLADTLISEIEGAIKSAENAQKAWLLLEQRRVAVERLHTDTAKRLNKIGDSRKDAPLIELGKRETAVTNLEKEKTKSGYESKLGTLETAAALGQTEAHSLFADSARPDAEQALINLDSWVQEFDRVTGTKHALTDDNARLVLAFNNADLETDGKKRGKAYGTVNREAVDIMNICNPAYTEWQGIHELLGWAESWFNDGSVTNKGTLPQDKQDATDLLNAAILKPTASDFASALPALRVEAQRIYDEGFALAIPGVAKSRLGVLASWLSFFSKLATPNAVKKTYDELQHDEIEALKLAGKARSDALGEVRTKTNTAVTLVNEISSISADIKKRIRALEKSAFGKLGFTGPEPEVVETYQILAGLATACSSTAGATIADLKSAFELLQNRIGQVEVAVDARLAAGIPDVGAEKLAVGALLTKAETVVSGLPPGDIKDDFDQQVQDRQQDLIDVDSLVGEPAQKGALLTLGRQAKDLLYAVNSSKFAALMADGKEDEIDNEILSLGKTADTPEAQAIIRAALEWRFNVYFEVLPGLDAPALPRIYKMFKKVPKSHVGHEKLNKLEYETDRDINTSYYGGGRIVLNDIGDGSDEHSMFTQETDPTARKERKVNYFKFTTLHEIGHAVDDQYSVMKMKTAGMGNWQKVTLEHVAEKIYDTHFAQFVGDAKATKPHAMALVTKLLQSGGCAKPDPSDTEMGSVAGQWDAIVDKDGWKHCLAIRDPDNTSPWKKAWKCADNFAYHEAYDNDWYGYDPAERAIGVSDYQWRAPGEWFADLYGLYHMKKNKSGQEITLPPSVKDAITKDLVKA